MDEKTLNALKASIQHWEDNAVALKATSASIGSDDCALCSLFLYNRECWGCPVRDKTEEHWCKGTPYIKAANAWDRWYFDAKNTSRDEFHAAARAEVEFLKSLLPPDEAT